jgi:Nuclease-related domain
LEVTGNAAPAAEPWALGGTGDHVVGLVEIIVLPAALAVGFGLGRFRRRALENQGEAAVRRALTQHFTGPSYHLLNNLTLPCDGGTTQIDHVLVSKSGIFVIESKHYRGSIFANVSSPTWTQVIFTHKYTFQNPLRQNYKHVKAIQQLLNFVPRAHIHSLVAFTGDATFKTVRPKGVFDVKGLVQHIRQFTSEVLTKNRLQFCVGRLECHRKLISGQTDVEHQAYLNRKFGDAT